MTEHAKTNIGVIERLLPVSFDVETTGAYSRVRVVAAANAGGIPALARLNISVYHTHQ